MRRLSDRAADILAQMEPRHTYGPAELQALVPNLSAEGLREVMQELWVNRRVERSGVAGWRREHSAVGPDATVGAPRTEVVVPQTKAVKPEDLFDHDTFAGFFK